MKIARTLTAAATTLLIALPLAAGPGRYGNRYHHHHHDRDRDRGPGWGGVVAGAVVGAAIASAAKPKRPTTVIVTPPPPPPPPPPAGTVVVVLPPGCNLVQTAAGTYYTCGNVFYQPYYQGTTLVYQVVPAPR